MRRVAHVLDVQKEQILQVAVQQFCEKGYAKTRMEDIARILTITKTPLYYHFKDKAGLFDVAFRKIINDLYASDAAIFAKNCSLYDKLTESFVACAISANQLQIDEMSRILGKKDDELLKTFAYQQEMQDRFYELKSAAMRDARERGELKADVSIDELYAIINASYTGVLSWAGGVEQRKNLTHAEKEQLIKLLLGRIFTAIKPLYFAE